MRLLSVLILLIAAPLSGAPGLSSPVLAASGACWTVIDSDDPTENIYEMETICVGSGGATLGEVSNFGDISQCGTVSETGASDTPTFDIDLSKCNEVPSHSIVCGAAQQSVFHCTLTWEDKGQRPVTLVPAAS